VNSLTQMYGILENVTEGNHEKGQQSRDTL